jgi:hypothetical protein
VTHLEKQRQKRQSSWWKEYTREWHKEKRKELKKNIFQHYGGKCVCCGEERIDFLTIDHINGGGRKHRAEISKSNSGRSGPEFYRWIIKNNFPSDLRVLCYNCNCSRWHLGKCPHEIENIFDGGLGI